MDSSDATLNFTVAVEATASEECEVHCKGCDLVLLRFPAGRFARESDRAPRASIIVCTECGTKNAWSGIG